ncbi:MAG: elongation factor 1-beta [archaeon]
MADVVVTLRIMPSDVDVNLEHVFNAAKKKIVAFAGMDNMKKEVVPVAFGLKSLNLIFVMDEKKGSTDTLESDISGIDGVESVEVTDVRRTIG